MTTLDAPLSERTTWAYDRISRLATLTLANGATTTYAYDAASRVTGVRHAKAGGAVIAGFQYARDSVGNPTGVSLADGNLVTAPAWPAHPAWLAAFLKVLGTKIEP